MVIGITNEGKERLRDWMLEADDDEFDPDVMLIGKTNHKVDIALGLAVLVSFLFGLYVMLTELLRWGWGADLTTSQCRSYNLRGAGCSGLIDYDREDELDICARQNFSDRRFVHDETVHRVDIRI